MTFLHWVDKSDGGTLKTDGYGWRSDERRNPCGEWRGRRGIFGMLGLRQGMPG